MRTCKEIVEKKNSLCKELHDAVESQDTDIRDYISSQIVILSWVLDKRYSD